MSENPSEGTGTLQDLASLRQKVRSLEEACAKGEQTAKTLLEWKDKYRALVEAFPDSVTVSDLQGQVVEASQRSAEMYGAASVEDMIGLNAFEMIAPEDRERALGNLQRTLKEGRMGPVEYRLLRRDGTTYTAELIAALIRDAQGQPKEFIASIRDITARKQAEEALRESEIKYRTMVEKSLQGLVIAQGNPPLIAFVNTALCDMLGYTREEMLSMSFEETLNLIHEEDRPLFFQRYQDRVAGNPVEPRYEFRTHRKNGEVRWMMIEASQIMYLGKPAVQAVFVDVTERKKAEAALERRMKEMTALNALGRRISRNQTTESLINGVLDEVLKTLGVDMALAVLYDDDRFFLRLSSSASPAVFEGGENRERIVKWLSGWGVESPPLFCRDMLADPECPREVWKETALTSFIFSPLIADDAVLGILGLGSLSGREFKEQATFFEAVTREIANGLRNARLYEEVQRHAEELEHRVAERTRELRDSNAELEAFAYSVSHDLRAPLRAMQGFSQALLEDYAKQFDETGRDYAERIVQGSERMEQLIHDLLTYSRITRAEIELEPIDLPLLAREVIGQMRGEIQKGGGEVQLDCSLALVRGHRPT
ncbi:MAG: PAS domain-containing sensor histidine kinase, partial [Planctomycetota bacterium]